MQTVIEADEDLLFPEFRFDKQVSDLPPFLIEDGRVSKLADQDISAGNVYDRWVSELDDRDIVAAGKGAQYQRHRGNVEMRAMIRSFKGLYNCAPRSGHCTKKAIRRMIVKALEKEGRRFFVPCDLKQGFRPANSKKVDDMIARLLRDKKRNNGKINNRNDARASCYKSLFRKLLAEKQFSSPGACISHPV